LSITETNKSILFGEEVAINKLLPVRYKFAWDAYHAGLSNHWVPTKISMLDDIKQWKSSILSEDERLLLKRCLGFFAGAESLVGNNLLLTLYKYITNSDIRQYLLRQAFEESIHNLTIVYICESLGLDEDEIYNAYKDIPAIKAKDDFLMNITRSTGNKKADLLRNIIIYYVICEGIFFYSGFAMLLSFGRQNKMKGISEQIQYTLRDETLHIEFGINLINLIKEQEPNLWYEVKEDISGHIREATKLEIKYAYDVLPNPILGLNASMFIDYMYYISNRRLRSLFLAEEYPITVTPFPWLSEAVDLRKNKNFFETTVIDYQQATLVDDWK
jgi:ribonucleoside-diphosphate reductase beta chain